MFLRYTGGPDHSGRYNQGAHSWVSGDTKEVPDEVGLGLLERRPELFEAVGPSDYQMADPDPDDHRSEDENPDPDPDHRHYYKVDGSCKCGATGTPGARG